MHNVFVGQPRNSAVLNLGKLVRLEDPDVFLLSEAKRLGGKILPGWLNHAGDAKLGQDAANCRVLVNLARFHVLERGAWKVPGARWRWKKPKPSRVYAWALIRRISDGAVFLVVSLHRIPGGPVPGIVENRAAWGREHTSIVREVGRLAARFPKATVVLGGDWNAGANEKPEHRWSLASLARDLGGAAVRILHIDGLMVLRGRLGRVYKLDGRFGSDGHRPVVAKVYP